jgi:hypothetical protein
MRIIDADYVKSKLNKSALGGHLHYYVCGVIDDAPTIEAEPVKHARWEQCCNLMGEYFKCSECGYKAEVPTCMGEPIYIFCPNCGAKMDGGEKK